MQPDVVLVELCKSRVDILKYDEEFLLQEAKNIDLQKLRLAVKQVSCVTHFSFVVVQLEKHQKLIHIIFRSCPYRVSELEMCKIVSLEFSNHFILCSGLSLCFETGIKLQLHKQFFACDGGAIFLEIVASLACGGGYKSGKVCDFVAKS